MKYETQQKAKQRTAEMVKYAREHEEMSYAEIGRLFSVSGAAVSLNCRLAGYRRKLITETQQATP
jgi:hypothetical protein